MCVVHLCHASYVCLRIYKAYGMHVTHHTYKARCVPMCVMDVSGRWVYCVICVVCVGVCI